MNAEKDLTKGPLWKQIILFSLPLMFSNILQALFNMSDIAVVGKFAGNTALGAVGSTTILVAVVKSDKEVTVEALDRSGKKITIKAKDLLAQAIAHEVDHLDGVVFVDKMIPGTLEYVEPEKK